MRHNWLPHNLREVADAIYAYMDGETEITLPGPDLLSQQARIIINKKDIPMATILRTGR